MEKKKSKFKITIGEKKVMPLNRIMSSLKNGSLFFSVIFIIFSVVMLFLSSWTVFSIIKEDTNQLLNNDGVKTYFTLTEGSSLEAERIIKSINVENQTDFSIIGNVFLPSILIQAALILIIIALIKIYNFAKKIHSNKEFFTEESLIELQSIKSKILLAGIFLILTLDLDLIFIYCVIEIVFEIILYLLDCCIKYENA